MTKLPEDTVDHAALPGIKIITTYDNLGRRIESDDGLLICSGCDGTSRQVRACLGNLASVPREWTSGEPTTVRRKKRGSASHEEVVTACANGGIQRLNELIRNA